MPTPFDVAFERADAVLDATFGEGFTLTARVAPRTAQGRPDVNARVAFDPLEDTVPFTGIFVPRGATINAHGRAMADSTTRDLVAEQHMISVMRSSLPLQPKRNDLVVRDQTGAAFAVTKFLVVDGRRAWVHLVEADASERVR